MSINSIFRTMSNAEKLSIGDIVKGVQTGSIPSYVGIPLIEKKTKEAQKLQMAQALMRQIQGGPPSTITDQVMQAADQVTRPEVPPTTTLPATDRQRPAPSMGIESADSNMPQEYAGGGIIAFADEGLVDDPYESYSPYDTPAGYPSDFGSEGSWKNILGGFEMPHAVYSKKDIKRMEEQNKGMKDLFGAKGTTARSPIYPGTYSGITPIQPQPQPAPQAQPQTPAGPATPARPKYDIERGQEAPPPPAPQTPEQSAFSGIEDLYKSYLDRSRADRDELRSMILGQKADRAEQEAENRNVSLMKAGFGMMAGESPFAGVNIGRGAMLGAESYGKGLEQLRKDDRSVIQQLASLGLKGQELEQAAMKMGVDMSHYKMLEPYYQSAAAENIAKLGIYPAQKELFGAEAARQLTAANKDVMETALLPGQSEINLLKAQSERAKALRGDSKPPSDKLIADLRTEREAIIQDPLNSGLDLDPEIKKALSLPGTDSYYRAKEWVRQEAYRRYNQALRERNYAAGYME